MADSFTVFEKFGDVCAMLSEEDRKELVFAMCEYGMYGKEAALPYHLAPLFALMRDDIDNSKNARQRGGKGGRPQRKPEVSENRKPEVSQTMKPEVSEVAKPEVSEKTEKAETPSYIKQTNTVQNSTVQTKPEREGTRAPAPDPDAVFEQCENDPEGSAFAAFVADCMAAFNEVTGKDIRGASPKVQLRLRRIFDNGRTVADVRRVVAGKAAQWRDDPRERRFITPETLFGDSFESYLNEPICNEVEDPEKPRCPACGGALSPISAHDPKAPDKADWWCPSCRQSVKAGYEVRP